MTTLLEIPQELKDAVFVNFVPADMAALSKTNKALHAAVTPSLYRTITLVWDNNAPNSKAPRCVALLRTLLQHPAYAAHVKHAIFRAVKHVKYRPTDDKLDSGKEYATIAEMLQRSGLPKANIWEKALCEQSDSSALAAFIIGRLTNLESLKIDSDFFPPGKDWMLDVFNWAAGNPNTAGYSSQFDKLVRFTVSIREDQAATSIRMPEHLIQLVLQLPKVKELELWAPMIDWGTSQRYITSINLTTLRIMRANVPAKALEAILQQTPKLATLVYDCYLASSESPLNLDSLKRGISYVRETLTHLSIRYDLFADEAVDTSSLGTLIWPKLGSLQEFSSLLELDISMFLLYGQIEPQEASPLAEMLPPSLQRLTLNDDLWEFDCFLNWEGTHVLSILSHFTEQSTVSGKGSWRSATPDLREIILDFRKRGAYWASELDEEERDLLNQMTDSDCPRLYILDAEN